MNPLVPTSYHVAWALVALVPVVLAVVALVSLVRSRAVGGVQTLLWAALIVLVPILGAVAWLAAGRGIRQPAGALEH